MHYLIFFFGMLICILADRIQSLVLLLSYKLFAKKLLGFQPKHYKLLVEKFLVFHLKVRNFFII